MSGKHTPSPWFLFNDGRCVGGPAVRPEGEPQTAGIAMCGMQLRTEEEIRANARLIVVSPLLLEMLELMFERDCRIYAHELTIPMRTHGDAVKLLVEARSLIQEARGGS